jgi:transcriptional regulator with XRE-family HTH domain
MHHSYWSRVETGERQTPSPRHLKAMAQVLKVPAEDLYALAGYDIPERLPSFRPYLRATTYLPPEAIDDLERYYDMVRAYYGIPKDQPVFPPRREALKARREELKRQAAEEDKQPRRAA